LDRAEVKDTMRQKVLMGQKMRCGSQILDNYIKHRKQKQRQIALQMGVRVLIHPGTKEWYHREY
jgi:hypothetical protein